ncbi:cyclase [Streptomyces broussonetiae]|uniref:Cyclase n=1 Tax=Streptomyces broussonetiae TaxID=2686304 RepID=A0A6I6N896_9ACTN|nr:SRPBCC family protein [Streptomyces broussonetiae]QHA09123.1 cyclase [Streptomyces broussonetiae]
MTEPLGSATSAAGTAGAGVAGNPFRDLVLRSKAADRLKTEAREYLAAQATRLLNGLGHKLGETTVRLNDIAEGNSRGFAELALEGGRKLADGKGPLRSALEIGASHAKDNVMEAVSNLTGGKGRRKGSSGDKPTVIMESVDVGVPARTTYDQWTRYQDFSAFAKGVRSASSADDTHSDWQAKVAWSTRSWKAHTTEQIPDHRIQWTSEGAKGSTKGVVTFHPLGENLTRVLVVMEYYPSGLFERTGNLWRAQGRRTRLDLKNFARFVTLKGEAEDGWRGEIRGGEVVRSHEDAMAEEEQGQEQGPGRQHETREEESEAEEIPYSDEDTDEDEAEELEPEYEYEYEEEPEYHERGGRR